MHPQHRHANMNDREFKAAYITSPYYWVPWEKISQYMDICPIFHSEILLQEFSNLSTFSSAFRFSMSAANELKNGSCILQGSVSAGSEVLITGKWTIHYYWPASPKCKSQLAVAQPHENASCWWTLSLPSDTCMNSHENDHFNILLTFFCVMISSWV